MYHHSRPKNRSDIVECLMKDKRVDPSVAVRRAIAYNHTKVIETLKRDPRAALYIEYISVYG